MLVLKAAKAIGVGLTTIGLGGAGVGVGILFSSLLTGISRNPSLQDELLRVAVLGFALTESIALLSLMVSFLILFRL